MMPSFLDHMLSAAPGAVGAYYNAYKAYRWGDPYLHLIASLADRSRLAIDVGAHLGEYTFFMRRYSAGCVAFECNPRLVSHLQRRFRQSVDIRSDAVSDQPGLTVLRIPQSEVGLGRATIEARNGLDEFAHVEQVNVHTVRLDDVIERSVGLIKIDVEGHELAVLRGATRILTQDRPNVLLEIEERHAPGGVAKTFAFMESLGYGGSYLRNGKLVPTQPADLLGDGLWNYVFRHAA